MIDRLRAACEAQFERSVEQYAETLFQGRDHADRVFTACVAEHHDPVPYLLALMDMVQRAERARAWFAKHGPSEYQPLPLYWYDEQETIICSGDFSRHLVVYYAGSLQRSKFDYLKHPLFFDYARGVMAERDCPIDLARDKDALAEFPPKPLPGLHGLIWSPEDVSTAA
jgi:hypothetical protein